MLSYSNKLSRRVLFLLLFALLLFNSSFAKDMHLFMVIDRSEGLYAKNDESRIKRLAEDICISTGMTLKVKTFYRLTMQEQDFKQAMKNFTCTDEDVVWFYYSGHGHNADGTWPEFLLENRTRTGVPLKYVHDKLKEKRPRLMLSMYDCCNHGTGNTTSEAFNNALSVRPQGLVAVYRKLFLFSKGDVMMCSSKQGSYSSGNDLGGAFTSAFITTLNRMQDGETATWNELFEKVKTTTQLNNNQTPNGLANTTNNQGETGNSVAPENKQSGSTIDW